VSLIFSDLTSIKKAKSTIRSPKNEAIKNALLGYKYYVKKAEQVEPTIPPKAKNSQLSPCKSSEP